MDRILSIGLAQQNCMKTASDRTFPASTCRLFRMQHLDYDTDPCDPMVAVPIQSSKRSYRYPEEFRDKLLIDVIHDGDRLPAEYLLDSNGRKIPEEIIRAQFHHERDWGANRVAERIAMRLGLSHYYTVTTARCLLDFGRFPGITQEGASHLRRFAINHPFSDLLSFEQKRRLLEDHYDRISRDIDHAIQGKTLKVAVHTYDRYNSSGTERPEVSLVTRALGYQLESELPYGVFDPLYPDILAEVTVDRILRDRVSLNLEKAGIPVAHNYPYLLPEGSPEVRHQVWSFFKWIRAQFEETYPRTAGLPESGLVWNMLMDTNLRSSEASALRDFLHMFRRPPKGRVREFTRAQRLYTRITEFVAENGGQRVETYRQSSERPMSLGIEVRKDLVWEFDDEGRPVRPADERAMQIADKIADAIAQYFREDRLDAHQLREHVDNLAPLELQGRTEISP
jgi:hypothetical protein